MTFIDETVNFKRSELQCHCGCGQCHMDSDFMDLIEVARGECDFPWPITSGYRCPKYDQTFGGDDNHPRGKALDIHFDDSHHLYELKEVLGRHGFNRFGISFKGKFLHVDSVMEHPQGVIWGY